MRVLIIPKKLLALHLMNYKHLHSIQSSALHFKQWSNKNYAAFCSMGKVVHIGKLAVALTQWIGNIVELVEETLHLCKDKEADEDEEQLLELELLLAIGVVVSSPVECEKGVLSKSEILTAAIWN